MSEPITEVKGLYKIIPLKEMRRTPGVWFDLIPPDLISKISAVDRVMHDGDALSPGSVNGIERPWYMHPSQDDNLIVVHGTRYIDIYTKEHGGIETFVAKPHQVEKNGEVIFNGPCLLRWPRGVFHRIRSCENGSASLNFAIRHKGFSIETNFNIYNLDTDTGEYKILREGHLDQPD